MTCSPAKIAVIRSGGQTGADRGAIDAAREMGTPIAGWCPAGGLAEDYEPPLGLKKDYPEFIDTPSEGYVQRTGWNVRDAHATLIVIPNGLETGSGTDMTIEFAKAYGRPVLCVKGMDEVDAIIDWLAPLGNEITLNVAGPRGSKCPEVYEAAKQIVTELLKRQQA